MLRWTSRSMVGKSAALALGLTLIASGSAHAQAVITKANNATNLDQPGSWVGGVAPTNVDTALWNSTVLGANSTVLGSDQAWAGAQIANPGGAVTIGGANVLTLGAGGINMSAATQNLTINSNVDLGAGQSWNVGPGRTLTVGGVISDVSALLNPLTKLGPGTLTLTGANTFTGPTTLRAGTTNLNYSATANDNILAAGTPLTVGNSSINFNGTSGGASTQSLGTVTFGSGLVNFNVNGTGGGTMAVNVGTFATAGQLGTSVRFTGIPTQDAAGAPVAGSGTITYATAPPTSSVGVLGGEANGNGVNAGAAGYATVGLYDYAAINPGTLSIAGGSQITNFYTPLTVPLANNAAAPTPNFDLQSNIVIEDGANNRRAGALRFNTPTATTITTGANNNFLGQGILITPNMGANNTIINGGGGYQIVRINGSNGPQAATIWQNNTQGFFELAIRVVNGQTGASDPSWIVKAGEGTAILSGASTTTGGFQVNEGAMVVSADNNLGAATTSLVLSGGVLVGNGNFTSSATRPITLRSVGGGVAATAGNTMTLGGVIADGPNGVGPLTVGIPASAANGNVANRLAGTGAGTANATAVLATGSVALSNANTYAGGTNIIGGTLLAANTTGSATGTGAISVGAGGGFGGTGSAAGAVSVASGGHITPGVPSVNSGVGAITMNGLSLGAGSVLDLDISAAQNDSIISTGGLTIGGPASVNLFQAGTAGSYGLNGTYNIFSVTSGAIPSAAQLNANLTVGNNPGSGVYSWGVSGTSVTLTISGLASISAWNVNGSGVWGTASNWSPADVPNGVGDSATFGNVLTAGTATIQLQAVRTVGALAFNNTNGASYSIVAGGGSLAVNNGASTAIVSNVAGNHSVTAPVTLASNTNVTVAQAADTLTISGNISGAKNLAFAGAGRTILSGTNTYVDTTVAAGATLQIGSGGTTGSLGSGAIALSGTLDVNRSNAVSLGAITGAATATVTNSGSGTTTLTGINTGAFGVTVNAGSVVVGAGSNLGTGGIATNGGTLDVNGTSPTVSSLSGTGGAVNNSSATPVTLTVNQAGNTSFSGNLTDTGAGAMQLIKQGAGQLVLNGTTSNDGLLVGTVTSSIRVEGGGSVVLNSNGSLPAGKVLESRSNFNGVLVGPATIAGTILLHPVSNATAGVFDVTPGSLATISGSLTTPATMTSNTEIRLGAGSDPTTTSLTVTGSLDLMNTSVTGNIYFERGSFIFAGNSVSAVRLDAQIGRTIGTNVAFTFRDNARFTAPNFVLAPTNGGSANVVGVTFSVEGNAVVTATTGNLNANQSAATGNTINLNGGRLNINTMTKPNGSATSTTTLNLNGGVLASSATGVLIPAAIAPIGGVGGAIVRAGGAKIEVGSGVVSNVDAVLLHDSALAAIPDGGLTKTGSGALVLTGANTYAGATTINGGTLVVNGSHGFNAELAPVADYAVNNGGRLAGIGSIGDGFSELIDVQVANGGTIAPGDFSVLPLPGTLTVNGGNVVLAAGGRMEVTVDPTPGVSDLLSVPTGTINLTALNNVLKVQPTSPVTVGTAWTIATGLSRTGTFEVVTPGYTATYDATSVLLSRTGNSADFDLDGDIDGDDLLTWQRGLGIVGTATQLDGDADLDGSVTGADLTIWRTQFLTSPMLIAASAPVPEPGMLTLIAIAAPALAGASRRRR